LKTLIVPLGFLVFVLSACAPSAKASDVQDACAGFADPLRGDFEKINARAMIATGKTIEKLTFWDVAEQVCDRKHLVENYCSANHLAVANLSAADCEQLGKKCVLAVVALANARHERISRLDREDINKACADALAGK